MATINLLNGQMLNSTLERDGVPLSIVDAANSTPLIYLDIANSRMGINTNTLSATVALTVSGNANATNFGATNNVLASGNVVAVGNVLGNNASLGGNILVSNFSATGNANAVNISVSGNINALNDVSVGGNVSVTGNLTAATLGISGNTALNNLSVTGTANIVTLNATNFSAAGNSTGASLSLSGTITALNANIGNSLTVANVTTSNVLSAVGNISAPNVYASTVAVLPNITGLSNGNVNLIHNGTGAVNLDNIAVRDTTFTSFGTTPVTIGGVDGVGIPYGNSLQRPSTPPTGTTRFNTFFLNLETWDGTTWIPAGVTAGAPATITDQQFAGDDTTTVFTLNQSSTNNEVLVSINGVLQIPGVAYTVSGTSITFATAPLTGDTVDIRFIAYTATVSALENATGTAIISTLANSAIQMVTSSNVAVNVSPSGVVQITGQSVQLPQYNVTQATAISTPQAGEVIYVTNGDAGAPCLAVFDGSSWKRIALGSTISAT